MPECSRCGDPMTLGILCQRCRNEEREWSMEMDAQDDLEVEQAERDGISVEDVRAMRDTERRRA